MIRLTQEFGAHTGRQLSFEQPRVRVGRAPTNEIAFDPNVDLDASANHCELVLEDGAFHVVDLGSRNGTYVNGVRVQKQRIGSGDVIECGRGGPRLRVDVAPAATMPAGSASAYAAAAAISAANRPPSLPPPPQQQPGYGGFAPAPTPAPYVAGAPPAPMMSPPMPSQPGGFAPVPAYGAPAMAPPPPSSSANAPRPYAPPAQPPFASQPYPSQPGAGSVGASVAAALPAGAQVGKRTVALMIDQALAQAGAKQTSGGLKVAMVLTVLVVVAGLGVGGWFVYRQQQDAQQVRAQGSGGGGGGGGAGEAAGDGTSAGERVAAQNEGAIYMLAAQRAGGNPQGFCTGFAVTSDLIATNAHCVELARQTIQRGSAIVALRNNARGQQVIVQPVYQDARFHDTDAGIDGAGFDVGLVRSATALPSTVRLASLEDCQHPHAGAPIFVYGFPGITMNESSPVATITEGVLNRSTDFFDRAADPSLAQKVQHTAQTTSGSSGSPIFLANNTVIGINAGSLADEERQSILDPLRGTRVNVEVNRSSNFKYGMRADLIRAAIQSLGETAP